MYIYMYISVCVCQLPGPSSGTSFFCSVCPIQIRNLPPCWPHCSHFECWQMLTNVDQCWLHYAAFHLRVPYGLICHCKPAFLFQNRVGVPAKSTQICAQRAWSAMIGSRVLSHRCLVRSLQFLDYFKVVIVVSIWHQLTILCLNATIFPRERLGSPSICRVAGGL